ncbi:MAG: cadmium-translocating P-type ATPase [Ruminococcus sp.]|jgi:Cd2+/Zn2+-exporting ATPase|nr:cadmium-translocating P-type ATPase [Ruminococcus sp.]
MTIYLLGLDCPNCAEKIRFYAEQRTEVITADVNLFAQKLQLEIAPSASEKDIFKNIKAYVKSVEPGVETSLTPEETEEFSPRPMILRIGISALLYGIALMLPRFELLILIIAWLTIGYDIIFKAFKNIIRGAAFDENFLMTIATIGAFFVGEYPEAVFVMTFYQVGELFQNFAVARSRKSVKALSELLPDIVNVVRNDTIYSIKPEAVEIGDIMLIKPGEKIAVDGSVIGGASSIDTKALTGESEPREISGGDEVLSGYINLTGTLKVRATKVLTESSAAVIQKLVESAASKKAKTEAFITRFSKIYTPVVVIFAVLLAVIPMIYAGQYEREFLYRALSFLVVSCPCALVISVPLAYFASIGKLSKRGVLVKGGAVLETLSNVSDAVFDKTGTLTTGEFSVTDIQSLSEFTADEILKFAAYAESGSNHPIAKAIVKTYGKEIPADLNITEKAGSGVTMLYENAEIFVGKSSNAKISVKRNEETIGEISVSDTLRATSAETIEKLHKMGIKTHMLTGDNEENAAKTAEILKVDDYRSGLLPAEKVKSLEEIKAEAQGAVIFTGDGINDAPVLALADCGFAMGGLGQAAAVEAADAVIADDNPEKTVAAILTGKTTRRRVIENISFALGVKFAVLVLSALGLTGIDLAVFADVGVSVICVLNSLRTQITQRSEHRRQKSEFENHEIA